MTGRLRAAALALLSADAGGQDSPVPADAYHLVLVLRTAHERVEIRLGESRHRSAAGPGSGPDRVWEVELTGTEDALLDVLTGRLTLGEAMYAGQVRASAEKAKHNLVVAVATTLRIRHEQARRRPRRHRAEGPA